jgi:beta-lactam-binding protein with PASTA domain
LFIFISLSLNIYTKHNNYQDVPNFEGIQLSELPFLIEDENLRFEIIDSSRFDPKREPLSVISHLPSPGSEVKENRKIYFTINPSGFKKTTVPNLIQITKRNAESIIKSSGFKIGHYTYRDNIGKDMVLEIRFKGNKIEPGILLPRTSKIDLVLGNGKR